MVNITISTITFIIKLLNSFLSLKSFLFKIFSILSDILVQLSKFLIDLILIVRKREAKLNRKIINLPHHLLFQEAKRYQ